MFIGYIILGEFLIDNANKQIFTFSKYLHFILIEMYYKNNF